MSKYTVIQIEDSFSRQGVAVEVLATIGEHKVRFTYESDSYKAQCECKVDIFNKHDMKWNRLHTVAPSAIPFREGLCYMPEVERAIRQDKFVLPANIREELMRGHKSLVNLASLILN